MAEFEVLQQREQLEAVEGAPGHNDDDCDGDDEEDVDGADCIGAIQLVDRECRGLVNTKDHLGR